MLNVSTYVFNYPKVFCKVVLYVVINILVLRVTAPKVELNHFTSSNEHFRPLKNKQAKTCSHLLPALRTKFS